MCIASVLKVRGFGILKYPIVGLCLTSWRPCWWSLGWELNSIFMLIFFLLYWPSIWPPGQVVPNEEFVVFQSHEMLRRPLLIYLNCLCSLCLPFSFCLRGQSSYGNESIGRSTSPDALIRIEIWIKMSVAFLNSTIICILSTRGGVCECETNKSTVTRIF